MTWSTIAVDRERVRAATLPVLESNNQGGEWKSPDDNPLSVQWLSTDAFRYFYCNFVTLLNETPLFRQVALHL